MLKQTSISKRNNFKIADGYVYHVNLKDPLGKVEVCLDSGQVIAYTKSNGFYSVEVPKTINTLVLKYTGFESKKVPATTTPNITLRPDSYSKKDVFRSRYKNTLSISMLELLQGGIAVRYERFVHTKHAVGLLATLYFFNQSSAHYSRLEESESMFGITGEEFDGVKLSPFYRFYAFRNHRADGFVEAKIPFGYFSFPSLIYKYYSGYTSYYSVDKTIDFWTVGGGISWGNTFKNKHFFITISEGIQFFPMRAPTYYSYTPDPNWPPMKLELVKGWWYFRGVGAVVDLKLSIGWIF